MLRKERKWNHTKCSIKTTKAEELKVKIGTKNKDNKQKTVMNI